MKKVLRGALALGLLGMIAFGLYLAFLVRSLDTPEFKARVAREASAAVGARVQFASLSVSLFRGVRLGGIRIQNPPGFGGDLLTAEGATLSYDLWPLLLGRIQLDELTLRRPVLTLAADAHGGFNYRKLAAFAPPAPKASPSTLSSTSLLRLVVSKLSVDEARFVVVDERNIAALRLEGASLDSTVAIESGVATGTGKAGIDAVVLANALYLRDVRAPLKLTKERMTLAPLRAKLGGGAVTGEIKVQLKPELRYSMQVSTTGANVATLIKEAGSGVTLTGTLESKAAIEGAEDVTTIRGAGHAQIQDCRWPKGTLFGTLADLLKIPELKDPRFDDCRVEFNLGGGQARTPVVSLKGPSIELTGLGTMSLVTSAIDYDMTLAIAPSLVAKVPATLRTGFKTRPDGFGTIRFKVTGTTSAPHSDLAARFGGSVAIEAAKEGLLGRLFGKKKPQP